MKRLLLPAILFTTLNASSQLVIDNATFFIDNGAVVTVQGDVTSNVNIQVAGTGKIRLGGTGAQNVNLGGKDIPNLQIDNATGPVTLTSAARVTTSLEFTSGKLQVGNFDLILASTAGVTGAGAGKFAETNGTGLVKKEMAAAGSTSLPVGNGSTYTPLDYVVTGGTYPAGAYVAARSVAGAHPAKHVRSTDYLKSYWKLDNNIAGATLSAKGNYVDPASVTGSQASIVSLAYNGSFWYRGTSEASTSVTTAAPTNGKVDLYGMNKFILITPKVFLQGAFDASLGLNRDILRNTSGSYTEGVLPISNILPLNDPYRTAVYSPLFSHVNNPVAEVLTSSDVLKNQKNTGDNIVDWVYLELRNKTGNTTAPVIQTRSALVQIDGDVVDIDGVSPVYFKNVDSTSNYVIAVKHRNHLGISSNPAAALAIGLKPSTFDFSNAGNSSLYYLSSYATLGGKVVLYGGNALLTLAGANSVSNYIGGSTDRAQLIAVMGNPNNALIPGRQLKTENDYLIYGIGDLNFDRTVNYIGGTPDRAFLLSNVMGGSPLGLKTERMPN